MTALEGRAKSIKAKLLNLHHETNQSHQYLMRRFAQERFLYRISTGKHRDKFILKGGLLITALTDRFYRATNDIDVEALTDHDPIAIKTLLIEAAAHDVEDDGMTFELDAISVTPIRAQGDECGLRLSVPARLGGSSHLNLQVDMGFGDLIALPYQNFEYPVLLSEYKAPILNAYSVESIIAEKLEAIASLDVLSTRYKDYDDVVILASKLTVHVAHLWHAIALTFERRETSVKRLLPALGADRALRREAEYSAYRKRQQVHGEASTFEECLARLRYFVEPLLRYDSDGIARSWENGSWTLT